MPSRTPGLDLARQLRREAPLTERKLWALLRNRQLQGLKFRRQFPVGPYVADFVCLSCKLIVEADGPLHDEEHDAKRDRFLATRGFHVLRFPNEVILEDAQAVFETILATAKARSR